MREWCSCGAAIKARRKDILVWRDTHRCPDRTEEMPPTSGGSSIELNYGQNQFEDRIGFTPNRE